MILTFDDGPDPVWTPRLLDVLSCAGARAVFFPIAPRASAHPALIERMRLEGHEVGLHCDQHVRHSERTEGWVMNDTQVALDRLSELGVKPTRWRTPWGDLAPFTSHVADVFGLTVTGWTIDTHDWRGDTAAEMLAATQGAFREEAVILAHDGLGPGALRADSRATISYVGGVAALARARGLTLGGVR